ncbi:HAD family hydrolase [Candidatus Nomurabacteria bacterium]|nr:HAD family hydrolase [Candidatus Nomurabacteria bacterium]
MTVNYKNKKVIGFDLDQTLYPKSPEIDEAIQKYIYEVIAKHRNISLKDAETLFKDLYKEGKGLSGSQSVIALGIPDGKEVVQTALEKADIAKFLKPDATVIDILKKTTGKFKNVDLITGSARQITLKKLSALGIESSLFNKIITKDDASKSDDTAYKMWLSLYPDFTPGDFLYIGDRISSDYVAPKKLGIDSILVNIKEKSREADCPQLSSFVELKNILL